MPSKKKKYNARFPPARIKKIMQTDEDVGKVAAAVPVIISRSLELFIDSLIEKTASITKGKNAKTLSTSHVKQAIHSEKTFDFLRDLVANVPDHQTEDEVDNSVASSSGTQEKKIRRPRKPKEEGARGPGRPRKVKVQEKKESSSGTESDEETETDEEQKFETETGSLHETQLPFISPPQASSSNVALDTSPGLNSSQHNYTPQHTNHVMQTLPQIHPPAQTPQTLGMTHPQSPPSTHPLSQTPPQTHPPTHVPPNTTNTSDELSQSNQYSHPSQSDVQTRQQFQSIPSYQMHNIPISQYPFSTGAPTMGTQPFIHPHTNLSMNSNNNPQFINQGMHQYPPQFVPPPYMVPAGPNSHGQNMSVPNMPQGMQPMPIHPPMVRQFMEPLGYDGNRHEAHVADTNMPLDMSMSTKSRSQDSSMPQDSPLSGEPVNMSRIPVPHGLPLSQGLMHGAYPQGQYTSQSAYFPGQNCGQNQPLPHSSPAGGPLGDMSLKAALFTEGKHKSNEQNTKNEDTKKNILSNRSTDKQRDKKSQKVKDNCEQKKLSLAELSNIMNMKPSRVVNDDDNDYDT